eukprot:TRINITY_DN6281_c0_g1_i6.p1 TRINITY_DN6281_c0_g1~~TRINITY_DN6281_c0_g1_i6.p1  ORF type:complete len:204 (-),score=13.23 TRINITY_DN6281_c0_g1_i6:22-612(-)
MSFVSMSSAYRLVGLNKAQTYKVSCNTCAPNLQRTRSLIRYAAQEESQLFQGMYGQWQVDETDKLEVLSYRSCLAISASAFLLEVLLNTFGSKGQVVDSVENVLAVIGGASLGAALQLIHIYVTPIKRFIQSLWGVGMLGGVYLMTNQDTSLVNYVGQNPGALWVVGPLFAAVTGLCFKEGVCYGKNHHQVDSVIL